MEQDQATVARRPYVLIAAIFAVFAAGLCLAVGGDAPADAFSRIPWIAVAGVVVLLGVAGIHYTCAAIALRGVSGAPLPLGRTVLVQLSAAAANRVVPGPGVGGAGVNFRYLRHQADMEPGAATSAVATIAAVGGLTDMLYVGFVTSVGPAIGLVGASDEVARLASHSASQGSHHFWIFAALAVVLAGVGIRARGRIAGAVRSGARSALAHGRALLRHPCGLVTATLASTMTTVVLGAGFIVAVDTFGENAHPLPVGALLALYWAAGAAAGATPLPAFCGMTEAAMIGGMVLAGYSPASATVTVLVYRGITHWLPLPVGLWAARRLHHEHSL